MVKFETKLHGDFKIYIKQIKDGILNNSLSSTLEYQKNFESDNAKCTIMIFERYSISGKNRITLTIALYEPKEKDVELFATASGGSNGIFIKMNDFGEYSFLEVLKKVIKNLK